METFKEMQARYYAKHETSRAKYEGKQGIYAIICNDNIVYVGKSTDLFKRFVAHEMNAFEPTERDYNTIKYRELREAALAGNKISFTVLEYTTDLDNREAYWIDKYYPALNKMIPSTHSSKKVESIRKFWAQKDKE